MPFDRSSQPASGQALYCHNCEAEVPAGASHCPRCCGEDGEQGVAMRRAVIGGMVGLMAGGVLAAICSSALGGAEGGWMLPLVIAAGTTVAGVLVGVLGKR
jgi:hypothetical protein